jgi:hypothetical protein
MIHCAKQVASKLQCVTEDQGCQVALMAALIKVQMMREREPGGIATAEEIADNPFNYARDQCYTAFCLLEDVRELAREKIRGHVANKTTPPPEICLHMEICDLALSLWMGTIGVGCTRGGMKAVAASWKFLASLPTSRSDVLRTMEILSLDESMSKPPIMPDEWLNLSRRLPEFLGAAH